MPTFPGDRFPIPPAEAEFRKQRAIEEAKAKRSRERKAKREPAASKGGKRRNKTLKDRPAAAGERANKKIALDWEERVSWSAKSRQRKSPRIPRAQLDRLDARAEEIRQKNQRVGKWSRSVWTVSGGLPTLGKHHR